MSSRKLRVLIERLPPESATWTAIRNATPPEDLEKAAADARPEAAPWSKVEMLLAQLIDAVNRGTYVLTLANSKEGAKVEPPEPVRRPGWRPKSSRGSDRQPPSERAQNHLMAMLAATS